MVTMRVYSVERHHLKRICIVVLGAIILLYWSLGSIIRSKKSEASVALNPHNGEQTAEHGPENQLLDKGRVGLTVSGEQFLLNGKPFTILGGSIHYFRVHPSYWKDRLLKLKAAGLNTVTTYVAWNVHEQIRGQWKWDGFADIRKYVKLAADTGLYVILRPGPFICAEWEFGGMPSWLLSDPDMKVRTLYQPFLDAMNNYFSQLMGQVQDLQYARGGPIIGFQVENEYGVYGGNDAQYMYSVKQGLLAYGVVEALFTSGNVWLETEAVPDVHLAINFQDFDKLGKKLIDKLHVLKPGQPLLVMEFWTGWFDHWGEKHHTWTTQEMTGNLTKVLQANGSASLYMFHGGTNFGFMNGANAPGGAYTPATTSYDYDAPLSEAGDMTMKYTQIKETFKKYAPPGTVSDDLLAPPNNNLKGRYGIVKMLAMLHWENLLGLVQALDSEQLVPMEKLSINNEGGQGYGYIVYRKTIQQGKALQFTGPVRDRASVLLDGKEESTFDWKEASENPHDVPFTLEVTNEKKLDILVENLGRVNIAGIRSNILNSQRKGIEHPVKLDGLELTGWKIYPLEFGEDLVKSMQTSGGWEEEVSSPRGPAVFRSSFMVDGEPKDTFINMESWNKGCVFINGFNIGRYWNIGPQKTLYIPGPILKTGQNELMIFELHQPGLTVEFVDYPQWS